MKSILNTNFLLQIFPSLCIYAFKFSDDPDPNLSIFSFFFLSSRTFTFIVFAHYFSHGYIIEEVFKGIRLMQRLKFQQE